MRERILKRERERKRKKRFKERRNRNRMRAKGTKLKILRAHKFSAIHCTRTARYCGLRSTVVLLLSEMFRACGLRSHNAQPPNTLPPFFLCTIFIFYFSIIPFFYFYDFSFLLYVWKFIFLMNYLIILKLLLYKYSKIYLFDFYSLVVYTYICIMTQSCFSFTFLFFCEKVQRV